jgi:hypothetical protein
MDTNKRKSSISNADSLEKMGEFWDTHDFVEFDSDTPDVEFEVTCAVPVEIDLFAQIEKQAHLHGVSVETLVNLWLQQKSGRKLTYCKGKIHSENSAQASSREKMNREPRSHSTSIWSLAKITRSPL